MIERALGSRLAPILAVAALAACSSATDKVLLHVAVSGNGTVTAARRAILCRGDQALGQSGACDESYTVGDSNVELSATPELGFRLKNWTASGATVEAPADRSQLVNLVTAGSQTWTATFELIPGFVFPSDGGEITDAGTDAGEVDAGSQDGGFSVRALDSGVNDPFVSVTFLPAGALSDGGTRKDSFVAVSPAGTAIVIDTKEAIKASAVSAQTSLIVASPTEVLAFRPTGESQRSEDGIVWTAGPTLPSVTSVENSIYLFGGGAYLVLGSTSSPQATSALLSADGQNWGAAYTRNGPSRLLDACVLGFTLVAVGEGGLVVTTTDATTWTEQAPVAADLKTVACSNTSAVAVGAGSAGVATFTSGNGATWTQTAATLPTGFVPSSVTFDGSNFVLVGSGGQVFTSTDGAAWTPATAPLADDLVDIAPNATGTVVAVGSNGAVEISGEPPPPPHFPLRALNAGVTSAFAAVTFLPAGSLSDGGTRKDSFVAVSPAGNALVIDKNETLTASAVSAQTSLVVASPTEVLAFRSSGESQRSEDGIVWTAGPTLPSVTSVENSSYLIGGGAYLVLGSTSSPKATLALLSADGQNWGVAYTRNGPSRLLDACVLGFTLVAVGEGGLVVTTTDATTWTEAAPVAADLNTVACSNTSAVAVGAGSAGVATFTSGNGITWTKTAATLPTGFVPSSVTFTGSLFVLVGSGGQVFTSTDGKSWKEAASAVADDLVDVASSPAGKVLACGSNGAIEIAP